MDPDTLRSELLSLVNEALKATDQEPLGPVEDDEDLFLPDAMDSVALATLVVLTEERYGFEIDDEDLDPETFESLSSVAAFVAARLEEGP